jgi:diguanylate cyclase (GGDEF)-like protein
LLASSWAFASTARAEIETIEIDHTARDAHGAMLARLAQQYRRTETQRSLDYAREAIGLLDGSQATGLLDSSSSRNSLALAKDVLAWHQLAQARYDEALETSDEAMGLLAPSASSGLRGQLYYTRGAIELTRGSITLAIQDFKQSASYLEAAGELAPLARAYSAIGGCYRHYSEYETAMGWHQKAYETALQTNDSDVQSVVLNNLGDLYDYLGQPEKALEFYLKSLELGQREQFGYVVKLLNIGKEYHELERYSAALESYQRAHKYSVDMGLAQYEPDIFVAMSQTYLAIGDKGQALERVSEAIEAARGGGSSVEIIGSLNALSSVQLALDDFEAAITASEQAIALAEVGEVPNLLADSLRQMATAYKATGDYRQALAVYERYSEINEQQLVQKARMRLAEMQSGLEAEVNEREIIRLQQENQIRDLQLQKKRNERSVWILGIALLFAVIAFLVARYVIIRRQSRTDELTQIANRGFIAAHLELEMKRFKRYGNPCCAMILDIDNFKDFNDAYGHGCGDNILTGVAGQISDSIRGTDKVGRWGGEEFVVLFPQTGLAEAQQVAERICATVEACKFEVECERGTGKLSLSVTITGGLARPEEEDRSIDDWLRRADQAMYRGKEQGKNCIVAPLAPAETEVSAGAVRSLNAPLRQTGR